jgi:hypothetical protein
MELLEFIHTKRHTLTLTQMPSLYILGHILIKKELDHLVRVGVLAVQQESEWVSPSFIIPKKGGRVCWISNLHQLNKVIRRKQYLLPIITDILCKHSGYKFFTKLDISIQLLLIQAWVKSSYRPPADHGISA